MKTLVILPNWVGDTVMAQPVLANLAASGRELHGLSRPHLAPLLGLIPQLSSTVTRAASDPETVAKIARLAPDEVVILPNSFRAAWLAYRARAPRRWGYAGDFRRLLLAPAIARPKRAGGGASRHQLNDYDRLLEAMRIEPVGDGVPVLEPTPAHRELARATLENAGLAEAGTLIGLFPGAAFGASKRWPSDRFAELARRLTSVDDGAQPILIAGPGETELARSIVEASGLDLPILGAELDLAALAALLETLSLLVTNDSGPMHLAAAVGTRCVALFGPTDPHRTAPAGPRHDVLWTSRWCSPCFRRRCPLFHHKCLRDIRVEEVLDRVAGGL